MPLGHWIITPILVRLADSLLSHGNMLQQQEVKGWYSETASGPIRNLPWYTHQSAMKCKSQVIVEPNSKLVGKNTGTEYIAPIKINALLNVMSCSRKNYYLFTGSCKEEIITHFGDQVKSPRDHLFLDKGERIEYHNFLEWREQLSQSISMEVAKLDSHRIWRAMPLKSTSREVVKVLHYSSLAFPPHLKREEWLFK